MIGTCQVCGEALGDRPLTTCSICATLHHRECWLYAGGCSTYACANAPRPPTTAGPAGKGDRTTPEGSKAIALAAQARPARREPKETVRALPLPEERPWASAGRVALVNGVFIAALAGLGGAIPWAALAGLVVAAGLLLAGFRRRWAFDLTGERLCCVATLAGASRLTQALPLYDVAELAIEASEDAARRQRLLAILPGGEYVVLSGWVSSPEETARLRARASEAAAATGLPLRPGIIWKLRPALRGRSARDGFRLPPSRKGPRREA